jgi:hypothetical protein
MSKPPAKIECTFCGDKGVARGAEDVFPLWIGRTLGRVSEALHPGQKSRYVSYAYDDPANFSADVEGKTLGERAVGRPRKTGEVPVPYKLPDVCRECNNGWMSRLEKGAQLVMAGFIQGKRKTLAPYDQLVLATWMIKTSLTYDSALPVRLIPETVGTRRLYATGSPLPGSDVSIAHDPRLTPQGELLRLRKPRAGVYSPIPESPVMAAQFAFQFDHLILEAVIHYSDGHESLPPEATFWPTGGSKRNLIWPIVNRFTWPSDAALRVGSDGPPGQ